MLGDSKLIADANKLGLQKDHPLVSAVAAMNTEADNFKKNKNTASTEESVKSLEFQNALTNNTDELSYEECYKKYGKSTYLIGKNMRKPAMLYTFPGSGNTWGRLLIDKASGIYSGSVYNDKTLLTALPGEMTCDWSVSVVKVSLYQTYILFSNIYL